MFEPRKFTIVVKGNLVNKVAAIKAIRMLTGLGLKEAKDASEVINAPQTFDLFDQNFTSYGNPESIINEQFRILRNEGVEVGGSFHLLLEDLRKIGAQALLQGEDEFASEILQLVLAEKLRRKP